MFRPRIEIHSESIRTIPIHSDNCIRANVNHSEPIRKTVKNQSYLIRSILRYQSEWLWNQVFNPDQSESIRDRNYPNQSESIQGQNPNPNQSKVRIRIRINPRSEWFGLILIENSVWINLSSDWFGLICIENIVSDWFRFIRIDSDWLVMNFNPIFSPGKLQQCIYRKSSAKRECYDENVFLKSDRALSKLNILFHLKSKTNLLTLRKFNWNLQYFVNLRLLFFIEKAILKFSWRMKRCIIEKLEFHQMRRNCFLVFGRVKYFVFRGNFPLCMLFFDLFFLCWSTWASQSAAAMLIGVRQEQQQICDLARGGSL